MTCRERVLAAFSHQPPDRVPIDLGGSVVSGIGAKAYTRLKRLLNLELGETQIFDRMNQLAVVDTRVLDLLGVDTRPLKGGLPDSFPASDRADEYTDEWGVIRRITPNVDTFFIANAPLSGEITLQDVMNYPWPDPDDPGYTRGVRERALTLRAEDDRAIVLSLNGTVIQHSQLMRGFTEWYTDIALDPNLICALIDQILEIVMATNGKILDAVGDLVDVVFMFDDMAMQDRLIVSPAMYRRLLEPRLCKFVEFLHSKTHAKIVYHTDGAIAPILPSIADMGIDGINPVQVSAKGMSDVAALKCQVGDRLTFWGGVDTQKTLPQGTPDDVRAETAGRIRDLNQDGGYVLGAVHNIQTDVPAENILALFETALGKRLH